MYWPGNPFRLVNVSPERTETALKSGVPLELRIDGLGDVNECAVPPKEAQ
jgi:hypothetical protein